MTTMANRYTDFLATSLVFAMLALGVGCPDEGDCLDCPEPCDDDVGDDDDDTGDDDSAVGDDDSGSDDDDTSDGPVDSDADGVSELEDCDDSDPWIAPGNAEICDGDDNDCDGVVDEDCLECHHSVDGGSSGIGTMILHDATVDGQRICVSPGVYEEDVDFAGHDIHLLGVGGAARTVIQGSGSGPVVTFDTGEGAGAILEGFTLGNGHAHKGGGVHVVGASPTLRDLVVASNEADLWGGGLYAFESSLTVSGCRIEFNQASRGGGAAFLDSAPTVTDCEITYNHLSSDGLGGGLYAENCGGTVSRTRIQGNSSGGSYSAGGGVLLDAADMAFAHCEIVDNHGGVGGGLAAYGDDQGTSVSLSNIRLAGNEAESWGSSYGGGIYASSVELTLTHAMVVGNSATSSDMASGGGGIALWNSTSVLENVVLAGNIALNNGGDACFGGAIMAGVTGDGSSSVALEQATIHGNMSVGNAAVQGVGSVLGATITGNEDHGISCGDCTTLWVSNVHGNALGDYQGGNEPPVEAGNISAEPQFLDVSDPDPLAWDVHLDPTSALVGAGDPDVVDPDGSPTDIGAFGGPGAGGWDIDGDGYVLWWHPGPYDPVVDSPAGFDCDDLDAEVFPGSGC
jgi:hypothetical protein